MTAEKIWYADATTLAGLIRTKALSSTEVVHAFLARIAEVNPKLNAVATLMTDDALESAEAADRALVKGAELGPLRGVPFSVKDSIDVAGTPGMRGSMVFADHVPARDATAVARMKAAGAIPLFKSNLPEFSMSYETDNRVTGPTHNPWRLERTPGGSSGGESAAIAAGMSPLGLGSDIAISLRGPAAFTGIAALKPTRARVPITGHWPPVPARYWHVGPMARSVRDLALTLAILGGPDGLDVLAGGGSAAPRHATGPLRIGWLCEPEFAPVSADVIQAVEAAADVLRADGCVVQHVRLPFLDRISYGDPASILFNDEIIPFLQAAASGSEDRLSEPARMLISRQRPSAHELQRAQAAVDGISQSFAAFFQNFVVLLCPVPPLSAPPPGLRKYDIGGTQTSAFHVMDATVPFNLTGLPALSVPFTLDREGLPIGVQLVANHFRDEVVLALGQTIEKVSRMAGSHPPL